MVKIMCRRGVINHCEQLLDGDGDGDDSNGVYSDFSVIFVQ